MKDIARTAFLVITMVALPSVGRDQNDNRLVHEATVNAPVDQVWAAYTTKPGLESWMVAHAQIDLRIGGTMKTCYDSNGTVDGPKGIENMILSYDPMRMLSFKVTKAPEGFPFPNAIKSVWTVVYFEPQGEKVTRVRGVTLGFGDDEESRKMREFFNRGNAATLETLQKRFAPKAELK